MGKLAHTKQPNCCWISMIRADITFYELKLFTIGFFFKKTETDTKYNKISNPRNCEQTSHLVASFTLLPINSKMKSIYSLSIC